MIYSLDCWNPCCALHECRGVVRGDKGSTMHRARNHREGAKKSQQCRKYFSSMQHICFRNTLGSNMGPPNLFLAPGAI